MTLACALSCGFSQAIRAKASELAAVEADIAVASAHARAEAWQILTPEQRTQAKQFQTEMKNRMRERRGALLQRIEQFFDLGH